MEMFGDCRAEARGDSIRPMNLGLTDLFGQSERNHCCGDMPPEFGPMPTFYDSSIISSLSFSNWGLQLRLRLDFLTQEINAIRQLLTGSSGSEQRTNDHQDGGGNQQQRRNSDHQDRGNSDQHSDHQDRGNSGDQYHRSSTGRDLYNLDFSNGRLGDSNVTYSIDDNKHKFGGSHVRFKTAERDGREVDVANFSVDRWPDLPPGWDKHPPAGISEDYLKELKQKRSFRAELTSYQKEDQLQPGHDYEINFANQLVRWDRNRSAWGDTDPYCAIQLHA